MPGNEEALKFKTLGNECWKKEDFYGAIDQYTKAIEIDGTDHILYSNRSAAHCKLEAWASALADANRCVELAPNWAKGYSRLGAAYEGMNDLAKSEKAYKKARELGGTGPSGPATGTTSTGTAGGSFTTMGTIDKALLVLRVFLVVNFVLSIIPFPIAGNSFQRTLLAAAGCYGIGVYVSHGKPERTQQYAQKVITDWRSHYLMTAFLFAFSRSSGLLILLPHFLSQVGYVGEYLLNQKPEIAARLSPTMNTAVLPRLTNCAPEQWASLSMKDRWVRYNAAIVELNASFEVGIGLSLIFELFTPYRNILVLFAYWHFMRIRYMISPEIKKTFTALDQKIVGLIGRFPAAYNLYGKLRDFMASMVAMPNPQQQQQQGGGLMSKCSIM